MRRLAIAATLLFALPTAIVAAPIDYVPTDTPYLLTSLNAMPPAAQLRFQRYLEPFAAAMKSGFNAGMMKELARSSGADDKALARVDLEQQLQFLSDLGQIWVSDDAALKAGFKPKALFAIYGVGAVPVLRLEISDAAKVADTIAQSLAKIIELSKRENAKKPAKERSPIFSYTKSALRGGEIFRLGTEKIQPVVVIEGKYLVLSMLPLGAKADLVDMVAPANAISAKAVGNKLTALRAQYGFDGFGIGFVEFVALSKVYMGSPNRLEAALWAASKKEQLPVPTAACKTEMLAAINNMPRMVMGYTELSGTQFTQKLVLELSPPVAQKFASSVSPMPAFGAGTAFKMGFSIDPLKLMDAMRVQADKITTNPYTCKELLSMNESAAKLKESLANPMLGMVAMVKGFGVSADTFEMDIAAESPEPRNVSGNVAIFTDQPEAVLGMLQGYVAQLANTKPTLDGKPVALDAALFAGIPKGSLSANEGYAAMTKSMLILGVGKNRAAELSALQRAPASKTGESFALYYGPAMMQMMVTSMEQGFEKSNASMPAGEKVEWDNVMLAYRQMMNQLDGMGFSMGFSKDGLEVISNTRYKK